MKKLHLCLGLICLWLLPGSVFAGDTTINITDLFDFNNKSQLPQVPGEPIDPEVFSTPADKGSDPFADLFNPHGGSLTGADIAGVWNAVGEDGKVWELGFTLNGYTQMNVWIPQYEYNPIVLVGQYQIAGMEIHAVLANKRMQQHKFPLLVQAVRNNGMVTLKASELAFSRRSY